MSTLSAPEIPLDAAGPAQRLRRIAAAVRVHFTWWGIHRTLTSQQKEEVGATWSADARLLTAGKKLIDSKHEAVRTLTSLRGRVTSYWRGLTLPYTEPGVRLIRQSDVEAFVHKMGEHRDELAQAEAELNAVFEQVKSDARRRLGRLYNPSDYPPEVRGLFAVDWDFPSVEPPAYLLRIAPDVYEQERQRASAHFEEAVRLAEQAFIEEFRKLLSHLTERLADDEDGERRVFRDSCVSNLRQFFERFRHLNVSSNSDLDALVEEAQRLVQGVTPQRLRDDTALRSHVAMEMNRVQTQVAGLITEVPRRRLVRHRPSANGGGHATAD
jgi:hypothetical protein